MLTKEQVRFFDTFGYFVLRNQFSANEVGAISNAFDDVFRTHTCVTCETGAFGGMGRHYVVGFIERRPVLEDLAEDDRVYGPLSQLLDPEFIWVASDGNLYVGDSEWHTDKRPSPGYKQIKVAFYLDPLEANTGCLRVIPGSHRPEFHDVLRKQLMEKDRRTSQERPLESLGVAGSEVPCAMLESQPGDVVFFRQEIFHASFGGLVGRRMLAMGIFDRPKTKELSQNTRPITSLNVFQDYLYGSAKRIRRSHMSEREKLGTIWEVSDELWERIEPVILEEDPPKARGRKRADAREMLNGIIFRLRSGCQWNQLPKELGDDSTIHRTLQRWVELGVMRRVWAALIEGCDELGGVQWEWQAADAAMSKARLVGT